MSCQSHLLRVGNTAISGVIFGRETIFPALLETGPGMWTWQSLHTDHRIKAELPPHQDAQPMHRMHSRMHCSPSPPPSAN